MGIPACQLYEMTGNYKEAEKYYSKVSQSYHRSGHGYICTPVCYPGK